MSNNYFFTSPSFVDGVARIFDVSGTYNNGCYWISATPAEADARAARMDWNAVLSDFNTAYVTDESQEKQEAAA